jgi:hypothetical protein
LHGKIFSLGFFASSRSSIAAEVFRGK